MINPPTDHSNGAKMSERVPDQDATSLYDQNDPETNQDPRHQRRIQLLKQLFAWQFLQTQETAPSPTDFEAISDIIADIGELDAAIQEVATERPLDEINQVDRAILRLILHEHCTNNTPAPVLIDEGVELAKEFSLGNSHKFVNAVLAKLLDRGTPQSAE